MWRHWTHGKNLFKIYGFFETDNFLIVFLLNFQVEYKVVDEGTDKRPVVLQEIGKQPSKFFISETQKKAKAERQRNLLLMAVAYSANIGGIINF